ncbi:uncharacterized protein LOC141860577 [Acropora palmata]|uniref:uncharacterized protein LOC141860577 n=1 Tax=Acropora palmata TaxID=6131 RepID=UPI003DA18ACA
MHLFNKEAQSSGIIDGHEEVIIRSFELRDSHVIRNIFVTSMGEMRGPLVHDVMHQALLFGLCLLKICSYLSLVQSRPIAASNSATVTYLTEPGEEFSPIDTFDAV